MKTLISMMVLVFVGCGDLEAEYVSKIDTTVPTIEDGVTDPEPVLEQEEETTPYVCIDDDHDNYCTLSKNGEVTDCNESLTDSDGDGVIDGPQFHKDADDDQCDGIDQDCDGITDGFAPHVMMYRDIDGDTFGSTEHVSTCTTEGFSEVSSDCDDSRDDVHPSAEDKPGDGIDQDCDDETAPVESDDVPVDFNQFEVKVHLPMSAPLEMHVQLASSKEDLGKWWDEDLTTNVNESTEISAFFTAPSDVRYIRLNVTIGDGDDFDWLVEEGSDDMLELLEGALVTVTVSGLDVHIGRHWLWKSTKGGGSYIIPLNY